MKRILVFLSVVLVAAIGFFAGRMTAPPHESPAEPVAFEEAPPAAFPEPPETTPYVPAVTEQADEKGLIIESPVEQAAADGPFELNGRAVAAGMIKALLRRSSDREIVWSGDGAIEALPDSEFGRFSMTVDPMPLEAGGYVLEVSRFAADSEEPMETVTRDIAVGIADAVRVKVYFPKIEYGGVDDCSSVTGVERIVSSKDAVYRLTVEELLKGPTKAEQSEGLTTLIPKGVVLKSVAADANGTIVADFNSSMDKGVAGSCMVGAIRAQVTETLRQFPEVRDVIIAVEGRYEDVLQP